MRPARGPKKKGSNIIFHDTTDDGESLDIPKYP